MAEEKTTKIKKKRWIQIVAPANFNNELIGGIPVVESKLVIGRLVTANLMSLTNDMKKQNINLKFVISKIHEDKAVTSLYGYYLNSASIKRLVRKGKQKVEVSFACKTADNRRIRIKPVLIPINKVKGSISSALEKAVVDYIVPYAAKTNFDAMIRDLISGKLKRDIKTLLKKIYPVRVVEIAKLHIEEGKNKTAVRTVEVKEIPKEKKVEDKPAEKKEEEKVEKKEAKKEEKPKETVKTEEKKVEVIVPNSSSEAQTKAEKKEEVKEAPKEEQQ